MAQFDHPSELHGVNVLIRTSDANIDAAQSIRYVDVQVDYRDSRGKQTNPHLVSKTVSGSSRTNHATSVRESVYQSWVVIAAESHGGRHAIVDGSGAQTGELIALQADLIELPYGHGYEVDPRGLVTRSDFSVDATTLPRQASAVRDARFEAKLANAAERRLERTGPAKRTTDRKVRVPKRDAWAGKTTPAEIEASQTEVTAARRSKMRRPTAEEVSLAGRLVRGGIEGGRMGAQIGSKVPKYGTVIGAGVGAVIGAAGAATQEADRRVAARDGNAPAIASKKPSGAGVARPTNKTSGQSSANPSRTGVARAGVNGATPVPPNVPPKKLEAAPSTQAVAPRRRSTWTEPPKSAGPELG